MTLKDGTNHSEYQVEAIRLKEPEERRLEALGLTEKTRVEVLNNDKKGVIMVKFRGTRFALGKRIAEGIEVRSCE